MAEHRFTVRYDPLPSQRRAHASRAKFKGFSGPVGSGKTYWLCQEILRLSVVNAGMLGIVAAPTYKILRDVTQRTLFKLLRDNNIPFKYLKQEKLLTITAYGLNSEISFASLDDPESVIGSNAAWFAVDELTYTQKEAWNRLQARLRLPEAVELRAVAAWTPKGFDWVYDNFIGSDRKPECEAILATARENYHVAATGYYESLASSYDPRFYAQEALGEYLDLRSGSVYASFRPEVHAVRKLSRRADWPVWVTCDFNIDPMCWLICQASKNEVEVLDEIAMPATINEACEVLRGKLHALAISGGEINITGDAAGKSGTHAGKSDYQLMFEFFARTSYRLRDQVPRADPPIRDRVAAVNAMLQNASGTIRVLIDPQCKILARDLARVIWRADSRGNMTGTFDKSDPKLTHASDALGYLIHAEFPVRPFRREVVY